jgi:hypothetical protein
VSKDKGRSLQPFDHVRHGKGLSAPCHTKQALETLPAPETFDKTVDSFRLIPCWRPFRKKLET